MSRAPTESPAPPTKARDSEARNPSTRELILKTALEAFSIQGFEGATTRSIATAAGVIQGLIPYYFKTKQALWRESVDRAFEALHVAMEAWSSREGPTDRATIARMIRGYVSFVASHPEFVRMMHEEGKRDGPRMRWLVDRHVRPLLAGLTSLASRMKQKCRTRSIRLI